MKKVLSSNKEEIFFNISTFGRGTGEWGEVYMHVRNCVFCVGGVNEIK